MDKLLDIEQTLVEALGYKTLLEELVEFFYPVDEMIETLTDIARTWDIDITE